jgi:hypothetical protein
LGYLREPVLIPIWGWGTPARSIPERQVGDFRIIKRIVKVGSAWPMNGTLGYDYCVFMDDAPMTILQQRQGENWRDWMVDSPYDWYAMGEYAMRARPPSILVAGLGLTLVDQHLAQRRDIVKVKIVELNEEVIEMVAPHLPEDPRFEVVHGDFFDVLPLLSAASERYDTIIMDIWTGGDEESLPDFRRARAMVEKLYPGALHLYHSFQKAVDADIINSHLPHEGGLSFVPERYSVEELRRRQAAKKRD